MAGENPATWYVRGGDNAVFGPIDTPTLLDWAKDSRIEPTFSLSHDKEHWIAAPDVKELEMVWLVETPPGMFYGPFNRAVVDGLLAGGSLDGAAVRLYRLDDGRGDAERQRLETELSASKSTIADLERQAAQQVETTKRSLTFMEAKLSELTAAQDERTRDFEQRIAAMQAEAFSGRERVEELETRVEAESSRAKKSESECEVLRQRVRVAEAELDDLRAQLASVTKFSAVEKSKALVPEVVQTNPPPPKSPLSMGGRGGAAGLAALEAAARRELSVAKRQGLGIGNMFGGRK